MKELFWRCPVHWHAWRKDAPRRGAEAYMKQPSQQRIAAGPIPNAACPQPNCWQGNASKKIAICSCRLKLVVLDSGKMVPKKVFFTKGVGVHKEKLASFEMALRVAGLAHCNLVLVSSIYPPGCKIISKEEGLKLLRPGEIVFAVYDRESYNEPNRLIA